MGRHSGGRQSRDGSAPDAWGPGPILELPARPGALRVPFRHIRQQAEGSRARLVHLPRLTGKMDGISPDAGRGNDPVAAAPVTR